MSTKEISRVMRRLSKRRWRDDTQKAAHSERMKARAASMTDAERKALGARLAAARKAAKGQS